jgi:hypothetical protein
MKHKKFTEYKSTTHKHLQKPLEWALRMKWCSLRSALTFAMSMYSEEYTFNVFFTQHHYVIVALLCRRRPCYAFGFYCIIVFRSHCWDLHNYLTNSTQDYYYVTMYPNNDLSSRCSELSSGLYCRIKWLSTDVSEVRTASIIRDDPEDNSEHHTRRRENLKSLFPLLRY